MSNKTLSILKWVGIALACLSTIFTLVIVGSHLSGRLVGMGKIGIIGTVGAELMAIISAWLAVDDNKRVAGVAMICQIVLTAVLLVNASIALDLDWQENLANKASEQHLLVQRQAAEEQRKLLEMQAQMAGQLAQQDKALAREFVRSGKATAKLPTVEPAAASTTAEASAPLDISKLNTYERYGLTIVPLFLALLTVIALGLAAHSGQASPSPTSSNEIRMEAGPIYAAYPDGRNIQIGGPVQASQRSQQPRSNFVPPVATQSPTIATQTPSVATQGATQDGLTILRQTLSDIAFRCPGKWFKADVRPDHVRIRLNHREQGKEVTEQSCKLKLDVLTSAVEMEPGLFRDRLARLLVKKGFQI